MTLRKGGRRIARVRQYLLVRDGARCGRCGGVLDMRLSGLDPDGPTLGHILPLSRGGTDDLENVQLEHRKCNLAASNRFIRAVANIVRPFTVF
jgi:5-methylcytosine-specific restriction endonuclease McrA